MYLASYNVAKFYKWEYNEKTYTEHYFELFFLMLFTTVLYLFGNYENTFSKYTFIGVIVGCFAIAYIGNLPGFQFNAMSIFHLEGAAQAVVTTLLGLMAAFFIFTFFEYRKCDMTSMYFVWTIIPIALFSLSMWASKLDHQDIYVHHWQWATLLLLFSRFPDRPLLNFGTGAFMGIMIDGISRYGPAPFQIST
jgi:hypothetical protein